jgi:type 1 glutamine amidotransferase
MHGKMIHRRLVASVVLLPFLLWLGQTSEPGSPPKRVLLVTGIDYPGHPWRQTAPAIRDLLERDPRLRVTIVEDPHFLEASVVGQYDVILLHFMNWEQPSPGEAARNQLQSLIAHGKGLMLVHFACGAWQDWTEFRQLAGRVWDPKLPPHDPRGPFSVGITDARHPITEGLAPFETDDELYTCLVGDRSIEIIAAARSKVDGLEYPMAFVLKYGEGRVFHTVLGHDLKAVTNSTVPELFRRGCAWAAGLAPLSDTLRASAIPVESSFVGEVW